MYKRPPHSLAYPPPQAPYPHTPIPAPLPSEAPQYPQQQQAQQHYPPSLLSNPGSATTYTSSAHPLTTTSHSVAPVPPRQSFASSQQDHHSHPTHYVNHNYHPQQQPMASGSQVPSPSVQQGLYPCHGGPSNWNPQPISGIDARESPASHPCGRSQQAMMQYPENGHFSSNVPQQPQLQPYPSSQLTPSSSCLPHLPCHHHHHHHHHQMVAMPVPHATEQHQQPSVGYGTNHTMMLAATQAPSFNGQFSRPDCHHQQNQQQHQFPDHPASFVASSPTPNMFESSPSLAQMSTTNVSAASSMVQPSSTGQPHAQVFSHQPYAACAELMPSSVQVSAPYYGPSPNETPVPSISIDASSPSAVPWGYSHNPYCAPHRDTMAASAPPPHHQPESASQVNLHVPLPQREASWTTEGSSSTEFPAARTSSFSPYSSYAASSASLGSSTQKNPHQQSLPPRPASAEHRCDLCNITCWDQRHLNEHFRGKNHQRRMRQLQLRSVLVSGLPFPVPAHALQQFFEGLTIDATAQMPYVTASEDSQGPFQYVTFISEHDAELALTYTGQQLMGYPIVVQTARKSWECRICGLTLNSAEQYDQHLLGAKHRSKMADFLEDCTVDVEGVPASVAEADLLTFFTGFKVVPNGVALTLLPPSTEDLPSSCASTSTPLGSSVVRLSIGGGNLVLERDPIVDCRVTLESPEEARRAVNTLNGQLLNGVPVSLSIRPHSVASSFSSSPPLPPSRPLSALHVGAPIPTMSALSASPFTNGAVFSAPPPLSTVGCGSIGPVTSSSTTLMAMARNNPATARLSYVPVTTPPSPTPSSPTQPRESNALLTVRAMLQSFGITHPSQLTARHFRKICQALQPQLHYPTHHPHAQVQMPSTPFANNHCCHCCCCSSPPLSPMVGHSSAQPFPPSFPSLVEVRALLKRTAEPFGTSLPRAAQQYLDSQINKALTMTMGTSTGVDLPFNHSPHYHQHQQQPNLSELHSVARDVFETSRLIQQELESGYSSRPPFCFVASSCVPPIVASSPTPAYPPHSPYQQFSDLTSPSP